MTLLLLREPPDLPERLLAKLWMARAGRRMRTTDGRRVRVLYPGRPAPGHGPDFRDAVLELEGQRVRGPVELHRAPRDWTAHGHSGDPAYDGVVLHVVGAAGAGGPDLPMVRLDDDAAQGDAGSGKGQPLANLAALDDQALRDTLRRAGMARFRERTERAAQAVALRGVEQALYAAMMEALGYSENRKPFAELARRLPASMLRAAAMAFPAERRATLLRDLLASAAGLEAPSEAWLRLGGSAPMERTAWRLAGVRPSNHPLRRIEAAAAMLSRGLPHGLAALAARAVTGPPHRRGGDGSRRAATGADAARALVAVLRQDQRDARDPSTRADPQAGRERGGPKRVLGEQRAREIAVNAVLPTLLAWARAKRDRVLTRACVVAYEAFPAPGENTVTREARRLLGERGARLRLDACGQQGLLHLYRRAVGR